MMTNMIGVSLRLLCKLAGDARHIVGSRLSLLDRQGLWGRAPEHVSFTVGADCVTCPVGCRTWVPIAVMLHDE